MVLNKPGLEDAVESRALKRVKRTHSRSSPGNKNKENEINVEESENEDSQSSASITVDDLDGGLDDVLLPDLNDEAAREYTRTEKYKSSMYVDAFNLALDTVLQDELHLFSDAEQEVFAKYRSLEYEPQFLYTIHHPMSL